MGRRVLPKRDPSVDFSGYIREVESLDSTFDPQSLFIQAQDLEIEVGSGKGLFLLNSSRSTPNRNFLGNEISHKYCRFAAYRLAQHNVSNGRVLRGDGLRLFREFLADEIAVGVHVYFPDPWWKARHRRRRVMQPGFIQDIQRVLKPGGIFHFWTDVEEYFDETIELMQQHSQLSGPHRVEEKPAEHSLDYRTHFERRMRLKNHDVFRSQFFKSHA